MAQYYHVYSLDQLPLQTIAILACGLPAESRIIKKIMDTKYDIDTYILANIYDYLAVLTWFQTKDGHKNRNRPKSFVKILTDKKTIKQEKTFSSPEEFERERKRILEGA